MKLSDKQAHFLIHLLQDTLTKNVVGYLSTTHETRTKMLNGILNQQSEEIIELRREPCNISESTEESYDDNVHKVAIELAYEYYNGEIVGSIQALGGKTTSAPNEATRAAEENWEKWKEKAIKIVDKIFDKKS